MSDQNAGSAAPQESSGSTETTNQNDKVAYETYRRVLSEAKKYKERLQAFEEQAAKIHEEKLKEQNEWKALAEAKDKEAKQLKETLADLNNQVVNGMKYQEFEKHLGGRLRNKDYASFIDFEKILINPETKTIDVDSVKTEAARFAKEHSSLVDFGQSAKLPNEAAKGSSFKEKGIQDLNPSEKANLLRQNLSSILK